MLAEKKEWQGHRGRVLDSVRGFEVLECAPCGFKHIVPIPTPEELDAVYSQQYYSVEKPLYVERQREDLDWWNMVYSERYDTFEELLPLHRRRILDVGCGPGFFLLHGRERGWQTLGMEPSTQAAAHCRGLGLDTVQDFLNDATAGGLGSFDVVHMSEVLEHIPDPRALLNIARGLLASGGLICVVVPNDYSPFQHALRTACGYQPWWVAPPHHINFFDFDSLSRLFSSCGFDTVVREATFPIDMFLLMGDNYVGNDGLGRLCHAKRKAFEVNMARAGMRELKRSLYAALASMGIGREVQIFGRKRSNEEQASVAGSCQHRCWQ